MPTYRYEARCPGGETAKGVVEALNTEEAVAKLRQSSFEAVLSMKEVPAALVRDPAAKLRKVKVKSLALTCRQFSIILKAGLPLVQTVELAAGQCEDQALSGLLRQAAADVAGGWALSYSFDQRAPFLPVTFRETIRAGEESGDLIAAFERMSTYYDRMHRTHAKTVTTISYPAMIIVVAVIVVGIIMGYAVPTFTDIFTSMELELPAITKALVAVSDFFRRWSLFLLLLGVLTALGLMSYGRTEKGGVNLSRLHLSLPVIGEIARMGGASQFSHTMSAMLNAGMPILQAIDVSGRAMDNKVMAQEILDTLPGVEGGHTLGECMAATTRELPEMLIQMANVGEASGSMESTLEVLAAYYDNEVDVRTERALALLEPTIICVLSVFVVFILLAVYLPLFSMYQGI